MSYNYKNFSYDSEFIFSDFRNTSKNADDFIY